VASIGALHVGVAVYAVPDDLRAVSAGPSHDAHIALRIGDAHRQQYMSEGVPAWTGRL